MKEVTTETSEIIFVTDMSLSPSRSNSTMTSGDLADVSSSMSRSSSSGSRQNLASLEVMVGSLPSLSKSPDMDYYFTPPEPVAFNGNDSITDYITVSILTDTPGGIAFCKNGSMGVSLKKKKFI